MKIEIRSHYWPATPELREIKIFIESRLIESHFLNQDQIWALALQCREIDWQLMDIANSMEI
jgi:hypothetical protein